MKFAPPPTCSKCQKEMDDCTMEALVAPPAPTMYLTIWSCSKCKTKAKPVQEPT